MGIKIILTIVFFNLTALSVNSVNAALVSRSGGTLVYDTDLDITWVSDANLAATNTFGINDIFNNGEMTWLIANDWVAAMNTDGGTGYLGFNGWRLPTTLQPDSTCNRQSNGVSFGTGCTGSEMGHLFNVEGVTSTTPGPLFTNVQADYYWSGTLLDPDNAWRFSFASGDQNATDISSITFRHHAWAVHDGDIGVIPVPAAAWLFTSGLLGLIGIARRKS